MYIIAFRGIYVNAVFISEGLCWISSLGLGGDYFLITTQTEVDATAIYHLHPSACPYQCVC